MRPVISRRTSRNPALEAVSYTHLDVYKRQANALTDSQIADIRARLKLDGGGVLDTVATYERQVESSYAEYWNLKLSLIHIQMCIRDRVCTASRAGGRGL